MTTSFTRTRTQIAQRVLGKVLKIGADSAASADYDTVNEAIDLRLKELHKKGTFWRKVTEVPSTFSLTGSVASASAGAGDILFPIRVTFTNGTNDDPVAIIGKREYAEIEDKTRSGNPTRVLWKGGTEFLFHPVPTSNGTAKILYEKIADDSSAGAVDVDVAMIRPFIDIIKYDVADDYGIDEQTLQRWRAEAIQAEKDLRTLGIQRVDYEALRVDDFDSRQPYSRVPSDYGR
jgi:hypothetical protein